MTWVVRSLANSNVQDRALVSPARDAVARVSQI